MVQERRIPYPEAIGLSMIELNGQSHHHRNEHEVRIENGLPMIRGKHGQEEHLIPVDKMGGWVKGQAQALSPFVNFFVVRGHLIQREEHLRREKRGSQMFDGHRKKTLFPEGVCRRFICRLDSILIKISLQVTCCLIV